MPKDFISFLDWSAEDLMDLVEATSTFRIRWKERSSSRVLDGRRIALVWDAEGFRNRVAFELGIAELGGVSVRVPGSLDDRERIEDVARYLDNWFDAIIVRTSTHEHMLRLAEVARIPVINARTSFNHPCEILGDLAYVRASRGDLTGLRVVFVGEATNLGHSWFEAAARFPIHVTQVCPEGYEVKADFLQSIAQQARGKVAVSRDLPEAVSGTDVIYTDCWPAAETEHARSRVRELFLPYQVTAELLETCSPNAVFLPCPPVHRGEEVSDSAMKSSRCRVYEAKDYLLHAQNALLAAVLAVG